jgi:hypothetical protein
MQAFFMNLVPPSSRFFFSSDQKNALSLSLCVKCDQQQQTHKNDVAKSGINVKRTIHQSPITIHPIFFAGRYFHKNEAVICWGQGGFCGFGLWEAPTLWGEVMGGTLVGETKESLLSFECLNSDYAESGLRRLR